MSIKYFYQKGFGIAEAVMATGLAAGVALMGVKLNQDANTGAKNYEMRMKTYDWMLEQRRQSLSTLALCTANFGGDQIKTSDITGENSVDINSLKGASGTDIYNVSDTNGGITWQSAKLKNYNSDAGTVEFVQDFNYKLTANETKTRSISTVIAVGPSEDGSSISACIAAGSLENLFSGGGSGGGGASYWSLGDFGITYSQPVAIGAQANDSYLTFNVVGEVVSGSNQTHTVASGKYNAILGGSGHTLDDNTTTDSVIVGGANHNLAGSYNVIAGGSSAYIADSTTHSIIMAGANNTIEKSVDAAGSYSNFIGGGSSNQIHGLLSAIIGSSAGHTYGSNISLIGCSSCEARDTASAILGGALSSTLAAQSVIFGGYDNDVTNSASIGSGIISGYGNKIGTGLRTTILAGRSNQITSGDSSTILGGRDNQIAAGTYSSIIGGLNNYIDGINSMVINAFKLTADGPGHFMIGDKQPGPLATCNWPTSCPSAQQTVLATAAGSNSFTARFSGGFRFCTNGDCSTGKYIDAAASSWTSISDKNQKEAFGLINPEEILTSFSKLEIPSWNYKAQNDKSKKIIGPMAQDFYQLFAKPYKLFSSDKTIDQADLNGIILVGIKGLEARTVNLRSDQSKIEIKINSMNEEIDEVRNMIQLLSKRNK